MSGRKQRAAKRRAGIYLDASNMQSRNAKIKSGEMKSEQSRRERVDALLREHFKKDE